MKINQELLQKAIDVVVKKETTDEKDFFTILQKEYQNLVNKDNIDPKQVAKLKFLKDPQKLLDYFKKQLNLDYIESFSENRAPVRKESKWGFINPDGKVVVELEYDGIRSFSENRAPVLKKFKYGFINSDGKVVVELKYDYVASFSENRALVQKGSNSFYIDTIGQKID